MLGSKRAAPQAALRPLRTRHKPFTASPSNGSSSLHQGSSDDLFNVSPTASQPVFSRSFGKPFGALAAEVESSQQPDHCQTLARHAALSQQTAPQSPVGTAAYSPEGTAAWDLYAGTASATLSPPHSLPPLLTRWQQQQSRQEPESRLAMYQQLSGSGLMQLQQGQTLGGPPQQHLFDANPNSPRLCEYTQAQLWDHIQKMPGQPSTSPHQVAVQEQRLQTGLQAVNSPHMQQQQGGPSRGYTQQDCSRDFQQWDPFCKHGQPQQQGVQAPGTEQGKSAAVNADAAQACSKELQQWDPFLNHPGPQQQQQQHELPQSCTQEQDLQSPREQNAALRSQQWQLQRECNVLKQREEQWHSLPGPVQSHTQLGQKQYILEFRTQQDQDRYNLQAESLAKHQAQKHERYASAVGSLQSPVVDFEPEHQDQYSMLAKSPTRLRAQRLGRYARHKAALQGDGLVDIGRATDAERWRALQSEAALQSPGAANTGRAAAASEEEEALQAAMEASAKEYREQNHLLVDEEIVLPIHQGDRVVDGVRRRTAESLPIRHDHGVVWQSKSFGILLLAWYQP